MSSTPIRFTLRFRNLHSQHRRIVLEPWTGEYQLPPQGTVDIVVEGAPDSPLEIEFGGRDLTVHAFSSTGAMLAAYRDGVGLKSEHPGAGHANSPPSVREVQRPLLEHGALIGSNPPNDHADPLVAFVIAWEAAAHGAPPVGHLMRDNVERWFRIHSLPGSKRFA